MARDVVYGGVDEGRDMDALVRLICFAFGSEATGARAWLQRAGTENLRGARRGDGSAVEACLLRIPMGQYFGGKSVPMSGIAGVAVGPESRGGGLATGMMTACVREIAAEGIALSTLYASTQQLYRKVGYEVAGMSFNLSVPIAEIGRNLMGTQAQAEGLSVRPLVEADEPAVREIYRRWASVTAGMLDRGSYMWNRVKVWRDVPHVPFGVVNSAGVIEGYVYLAQDRMLATGKHDVKLTDIAWSTPRAGVKLLEFLAGFTTMGEQLKFAGGVTHPVIGLLGHTIYGINMKDPWMVRICDVEAALCARGYPRSARGTLAIDVYDAVVADNNACWGLEVAGGDGHVQRGAPTGHAIRCGVHALAQLYTGYLSAGELARRGMLTGSAGAIETAELIFAGAAPSMTDFF